MAELVSIKRNVDVSPGQAAPAVFHCSQGDVGSKIILGLLNNGTAYSIPSGVTVTIEGSESNGSIFTPISATASGSDITFYLTGEMTAVAGPAICQAVLKSGSNILGTANFTLEVESSPMGADAPPVFTDAGWTWMLNKLTTEFVPALGDNIIDAIDSKLDKNQGTANAGKYLKVGANGNVETADLDVTTDKTLSIADKAADAKAVGDELDDLKADLSEIYQNKTFNIAGTWQVVKFKMIAGRTYRIKSAIGGGLLYTSNDGKTNTAKIKEDFTAGEIIEYTAEANSDYLRAWFNYANTLTVSLKDSVIETLRNELSDVADVLEADLKYFDAVPISTFDKSMFEKGSIENGKKDTYKENVRIRSKTYLYSLQAIDVSKKNINSNATFFVIIYDNAKNMVSSSGWKTLYRIPKGVIFNVVFTSTNASTSETLTVDEIYNLFDFVPVTTNVVEDTNDAITAKVGVFNSSNDVFESYYPTRVSILDFIKCDNRLMKVQLSNGYKCYLIGYDKDFNLVKDGVLGTWIYNLRYVDVSKYSYIRVSIANSTDTALNADEALNNITIEKSVPLVSNYFGKTVDSFSKDGINQERKSYAPMYPQSSIVSFQKAFNQGFRSLMMHVQFTANNEMVLLHDVLINGSAVNADGTNISESLRVDQLTLEQLDSYDFGLKFGEQYKGTKITRFADGLMFAKKHNMDIFIEPTLPLTDEKAEIVCNLLKKYGYLNNVCYFSTRYVELEYVHTLIPNMDLSLSVDTVSDILSWADRFASLKTNNRLFFYESPSLFTDEVVEALSGKGIEAMTSKYTDDEPENLIALINENPYITRIVSQIIPANIAILQNQ